MGVVDFLEDINPFRDDDDTTYTAGPRVPTKAEKKAAFNADIEKKRKALLDKYRTQYGADYVDRYEEEFPNKLVPPFAMADLLPFNGTKKDPYEKSRKDFENWMAKKKVTDLRDDLGSLAAKARSKEDEMRGLLVRSTGESQEAVDKLLANLIDQTGYTAGLSKQAVAAQQASQGILRSGVTGSRLRTIDENRATAVTGLTSDADTQKQAIRDTATRSLQGVEDRRREIETQFKVLELKGLEDLEYQSKAQDIKMQFEQYINDLNISSQEKLAMLNAVGTIGQGIGMGIGYYAGKKAETTNAK